MFKFQDQNGKKRKSRKKIYGLKNGAISRLQIRADFRDYKSEQKGLQIGAKGITNRDSFKDFKWGQKDYKSGQRDFKSGQTLRISSVLNKS